MNKRKYLTVIGGLLFLSLLSSCMKSGTCECVTIDNSGVLGSGTNTHYLKERSNNLEKKCKEYEITLGSLETTCELR